MTVDYVAVASAGGATLACFNGRLIGMLQLREDDRTLFIENIAVAPAAQGLGLGSILLYEAERVARASGLSEIRLHTNVAMVENLLFYVRRGYQETRRAVEDGYHRVHFVKLLL